MNAFFDSWIISADTAVLKRTLEAHLFSTHDVENALNYAKNTPAYSDAVPVLECKLKALARDRERLLADKK